MAYTKRYAGGFLDFPNTTTPIDSAFLNAVETALLKLLDTDGTVDGQVAQWIQASSKYGPALLLNKNVDAAAAIAKSKLDFTGANGLVNADVAGAAAIARSKLDFGSGLVNADIAAAALIAISKLADPTTGKVVGSSGGAAAAVLPPGYEWDYRALTTGDVTVTATTDATAQSIIASNSVTYDGTPVFIEVYAPRVSTGAAGIMTVTVWEDSTDLGRLAEFNTSAAGSAVEGPLLAKIRRTPPVGTHVYTFKAFRATANGVVGNGAGGASAYAPAYIRVTKA